MEPTNEKACPTCGVAMVDGKCATCVAPEATTPTETTPVEVAPEAPTETPVV